VQKIDYVRKKNFRKKDRVKATVKEMAGLPVPRVAAFDSVASEDTFGASLLLSSMKANNSWFPLPGPLKQNGRTSLRGRS
jgi:hypothetical protein